MNYLQAADLICSKYNLRLSKHHLRELRGIIRSVAKVEKKIIIKQTPPQKTFDLKEEFKTICEIYGVTTDQAKSKSRKHIFVRCRVHFVRHVYLNNYIVTLENLAEFLNVRHWDIIFYRDSCKADVPIEPFNFKYKKHEKTNTTPNKTY
jgi:hypothetical protein